jgi:hypothetical protein
MTQPPPDEPVQELQPMKFEQVQDDGHIAVYRALYDNRTEPGTTFSLTVTAGSPGDERESTALKEFLDGIKAAFTLLDASLPEYPGDEPDEPFNPVTEVLIEPGVADSAGPDSGGFAVVAQTTAYPVAAPITTEGDMEVEASYTAGPPRYGREHRWATRSGKTWMTVVVVGGRGWIRPWRQAVSQPHGYHRYVQTLFVGSDTSVTYNFYGNATRR